MLGGGMSYMGELPEHFSLVVNSNSLVISRILLETDPPKQERSLKQLIDLAMLAQNMLKGKELNDFIKRSIDMVKE